MRKTRNVKLNLHSLESRLTPTVTSFHVGNITATNNNGNLSVIATNPNSAENRTVYIDYHGALGGTDVYALQGTYDAVGASTNYAANRNASTLIGHFSNPVNSITARGGNGHDFFIVTMDGGETLSKNISISTGAGAATNTEQFDSVQIQTSDNSIATINGNVQLIGGFGANNMFMFDLEVLGTTRINNATDFGYRVEGPNNVYGSVFQFSDCTFNNVNVTNAITLMDDNYGPNVINGNLYVNDTKQNPLGNYTTMGGDVYPSGAAPGDPGTYSSLFVMDSDCTITGNVRFAGSKGNGGFFVNGTVGGNIIASVGNGGVNDIGKNDFVLGDQGVGATIGGNVQVVGGNSVNNVEFRDDVSIGGSVKIALGNGANTYDFDHSFTIANAGNAKTNAFSLTAGNGGNSVGVLGGEITTGKVNVRLGNGSNDIDFAFVGSSAALDGTNITYTGGSGVDDVTLTGQYRAFTGRFGAGNDTFAYAIGASLDTSLSAGFWGDFGAGSNLYDSTNVAPVAWRETVRNATII